MFLFADALHFIVGDLGVEPGARATRAIGAGDAGKPGVVLGEAGFDAVVGEELEVVLVRSDREMGGAGECFFFGSAVRDEKVGFWMMKFHELESFGRLACARP